MLEALVSVKKALATATKLLGIIDRYAKRNTVEFLAARDELFRDWVVELANALRAVTEHLQAVGYRLDDIEARSELPDLLRIIDNYAEAAWREPLSERRRMFAYAAAGSVLPTMTLPRIARVERTIQELDPEDLDLLAALVDVGAVTSVQMPTGAVYQASQNAYHVWQQQKAAGEILEAAGCVRSRVPAITGPTPEIAVTFLGLEVNQVMATYIAVRRAGK